MIGSYFFLGGSMSVRNIFAKSKNKVNTVTNVYKNPEQYKLEAHIEDDSIHICIVNAPVRNPQIILVFSNLLAISLAIQIDVILSVIIVTSSL